jgi:carboxylesterase
MNPPTKRAVPPYFLNPGLDGAPYFWQGGPVGVLLIHGYTATPVEMQLVGRYLHERGCTVSGPQLPGHGTVIEDLHRCRWQDWAAEVEQAYGALQQRCPRVFVGGESLGGLLALHLGAQHPQVAGVIAFAPALRTRGWQIYLAPWLKYIVQSIIKQRPSPAGRSVVDERWQGYNADSVPAAAQLLRLQQVVRQELPQVTSPLLIIQGLRDQTLRLDGAQEVYDRAGAADKELVWMERSSHCVALDVEWEQAAEATARFIQRVGQPA